MVSPSIETDASSTSRSGPSQARGARTVMSGIPMFRLPHAGLAERIQLLPEVLHLVAQPGRVLEPQVPGGLVHLLLQGLDQALELLRGQFRLAPAPLADRKSVV